MESSLFLQSLEDLGQQLADPGQRVLEFGTAIPDRPRSVLTLRESGGGMKRGGHKRGQKRSVRDLPTIERSGQPWIYKLID